MLICVMVGFTAVFGILLYRAGHAWQFVVRLYAVVIAAFDGD